MRLLAVPCVLPSPDPLVSLSSLTSQKTGRHLSFEHGFRQSSPDGSLLLSYPNPPGTYYIGP